MYMIVAAVLYLVLVVGGLTLMKLDSDTVDGGEVASLILGGACFAVAWGIMIPVLMVCGLCWALMWWVNRGKA